MSFDAWPIPLLFVVAVLAITATIALGHRLGVIAHRRSEDEKESPVSTIAGAILGLSAFILAFTFGIVADRYDSRRALVREDANAIRVAWRRAAFLPEADRAASRLLLSQYVDVRVRFTQQLDLEPARIEAALGEGASIEQRLWSIAVANARVDMNSDVAALYLESLDDVARVHATRIAVGIQARIPGEIWGSLVALTLLGVACIGYQAGIAGSRRPIVAPVLALTFGLVFALILALDRPNSGLIGVSQAPLTDLLRQMRAGGLE